MINEINLTDTIINILGQKPDEIVINGTGTYKCHSSIADCGVTGRKLACDFYSITCPIGGGSPWAKDASKADVSLNILARKLAILNLNDADEAFVFLSSCIGKDKLPSAILKTIKDGVISYHNISYDFSPKSVIAELGLNEPIFTKLCRYGVVGLLQSL